MKIDWTLQTFGTALLDSLWQGFLVALLLKALLMLIPERRAELRNFTAFAALVGLAVWIGVGICHTGASASNGIDFAHHRTTELDENFGKAEPADSSLGAASPSANLATRLLFIVWATGVCLSLVRLATGLFRTSRIVSSSFALPATERSRAERIQREFFGKLTVTTRLSDLIESPVLIGWIKPTIIFPASMMTGMPPSHFDAILLHELAHFRRGDYLLHLIQSVLESILFFHPAVWWISSQIDMERERACDDLAVGWIGSTHRYASALGWMEKLRTRPAPEAICLRADGTSVVDRIRRLARMEYDIAPNSRNGGILILTLLALVAVFSAFAESNATASTDAPDPQTSNSNAPVRVVKIASRFLDHQMVWQDRVVNSRRVPLFRSVLLLEKDGKVHCPLSNDEPIFEEFPNSWVIEHDLDLLDSSLPRKDADNDGFSNLEEFESRTDPRDADSHPDLIGKVDYLSQTLQTYPIMFAALPSAEKCQLNRSPSSDYGPRDSFFLSAGEISDDGKLRIVSITETEVIAEFLPLDKTVTLPKKQLVEIQIRFAHLKLSVGNSVKLTVREGDTFRLPEQPETEFLLEEVDAARCVISNGEHEFQKNLKQ